MREFLENLARYPRFLIGLILGIFLAFIEKLRPLLKNPVTAIALIGMVVGSFLFLVFTLRAMLGLSPT